MTAADPGYDAGVDIDRVAPWLAEQLPQARAPFALAMAGVGRSNLTSVVADAAGDRWVLRRPPLGELLQSAHDVAREHRILSALEPTAVPTPAIHGLCEDRAVCDAPLMLMEFVDGVTLSTRDASAPLTDATRHALGLHMIDSLAEVHAVDLAATGLAELATHAPYAPRQLRRWTRQWEDTPTRDLPVVDELAARLGAALPEQREVTLVHGDFHLANVIAGPQDGRVRAVVDWELSTLGDPVADLASFLAYWPENSDPGPPLMEAALLPGFATRAELVDAYADRTDRDLSDLGFWKVLALWKVAVIVEGVRHRGADEPGEHVPDVAVVDGLLSRAVAEADAAGL
jgi:aminoglycoside phosphotransferase (APT) family kinase protein